MSTIAGALRAQGLALLALADECEAREGERATQLVGPAEYSICVTTWRRAVRSGELRGVKVGRCYLAARSDVEAWIARCRVTPQIAKAKIVKVPTKQPSDPLERMILCGGLRVGGEGSKGSRR